MLNKPRLKTEQYALLLSCIVFASGIFVSILLQRFFRIRCSGLSDLLMSLPAQFSQASFPMRLLRAAVLYFRPAVLVLLLPYLPSGRLTVLSVPFFQGLILSYCVCCLAVCDGGGIFYALCFFGIRGLFTVGTTLYLIRVRFSLDRSAKGFLPGVRLLPVASVLCLGMLLEAILVPVFSRLAAS